MDYIVKTFRYITHCACAYIFLATATRVVFSTAEPKPLVFLSLPQLLGKSELSKLACKALHHPSAFPQSLFWSGCLLACGGNSPFLLSLSAIFHSCSRFPSCHCLTYSIFLQMVSCVSDPTGKLCLSLSSFIFINVFLVFTTAGILFSLLRSTPISLESGGFLEACSSASRSVPKVISVFARLKLAL